MLVMTSFKLKTSENDTGLINIHVKPNIFFRTISNLLSNVLHDTAGTYRLKGWKQIDKENIDIVNDTMLPEILRIQEEGFRIKRRGDIIRNSKKFREIFYVIKSQDKIIGYCTYNLKPELSFKGLSKKSVIFSIAVDKEFRHKGFGRKLLEESTKEMEINNVSAIFLYVNVKNIPAIRLYEKRLLASPRSRKHMRAKRKML